MMRARDEIKERITIRQAQAFHRHFPSVSVGRLGGCECVGLPFPSRPSFIKHHDEPIRSRNARGRLRSRVPETSSIVKHGL